MTLFPGVLPQSNSRSDCAIYSLRTGYNTQFDHYTYVGGDREVGWRTFTWRVFGKNPRRGLLVPEIPCYNYYNKLICPMGWLYALHSLFRTPLNGHVIEDRTWKITTTMVRSRSRLSVT